MLLHDDFKRSFLDEKYINLKYAVLAIFQKWGRFNEHNKLCLTIDDFQAGMIDMSGITNDQLHQAYAVISNASTVCYSDFSLAKDL